MDIQDEQDTEYIFYLDHPDHPCTMFFFLFTSCFFYRSDSVFSAFSVLFSTKTKQKLTILYKLSKIMYNLFYFMPYGGGLPFPQQTVMEQVECAADSWYVSLVFTLVVMK